MALVKKSKKLKYFTVVTIFVNPAQFNNKNDLNKYPSQEKKDLEILKKNKVDLVFIPKLQQVYPSGYSTYIKEINFSNILCGKRGRESGISRAGSHSVDHLGSSRQVAQARPRDDQLFIAVPHLSRVREDLYGKFAGRGSQVLHAQYVARRLLPRNQYRQISRRMIHRGFTADRIPPASPETAVKTIPAATNLSPNRGNGFRPTRSTEVSREKGFQ